MNALDIIVAASAVFGFYRGFTKGIVSALLSLVAVIVAGALALKLSQTLADYIVQNKILESKFVLIISFALIFIAIILVFRLIIKGIEKVLKLAMLGWLNKLVGGLLYSFIALFVVSALFWLGNFANIITPESKTYSKTYNIIAPIAPNTINVIAKVLPMTSDVIQKVKEHYDKI